MARIIASTGVAAALLSLTLASAQEKAVGPGGTTTTTVEKKVEAVKRIVGPRGLTTNVIEMEAGVLKAEPRKDVQQLRREVLKAVPQPRAAAHPVVVVGNRMADPAAQLRPALFMELALIRTVCPMTKTQRAQIRDAGDRALEEAAKAVAEFQARGVRFVAGRQETGPDGRKILVAKLTEAVQKNLPSAALAHYREELQKRDAEERRTTIEILVARLDRNLVLSREQRGKVSEALARHWDETWWQSLQLIQSNPQYLPSIPDPVLAPILHDDQREVWNLAAKVQWHPLFGSNGMGMTINENPLADEAADDTAQEWPSR